MRQPDDEEMLGSVTCADDIRVEGNRVVGGGYFVERDFRGRIVWAGHLENGLVAEVDEAPEPWWRRVSRWLVERL